MGYSTNRNMRTWAIIHALAIVSQLTLSAISIATFVFSRPSTFDDHFPSHDEFWDDFENKSTLPSVTGAVGGFATFINIVLFIILWQTYKAVKTGQFASGVGAFRNAVISSTVLITLVTVAELALAVKTGSSSQINICAAAGVACVFSVFTVCVDQLKLREVYNNQKKYNYTIELARVSDEDTSVDHIAPPPTYETAVGTAK
ncbi:hypothetical protein F4677DRAFT_152770 [Hypoxylon crocopeplum]|nr:hypothetical protein F4677DRAFT_152770 [Hypoxylon crocopeplum]